MTDQQGFAAPTLPTAGPTLPSAGPTLPTPSAETPLVPPAPGLKAPTLPVTAAPSLPPASTISQEPRTPHSDMYGLPMPDPKANTPQTKTTWKRRKKKGPLRKAMTFVVTLAFLGGLGYGGYLGFQQLAPEPSPAAWLPFDDPDTLIGRSNELTGEINDNSEELEALDQLGLDPTGEPTTGPSVEGVVAASAIDAQSYTSRWTIADGVGYDLRIDTATNNFALHSFGVEVRRVGSQMYSFDNVDGWTTLDVDVEQSTLVGLDGVVTIDDIIVEALHPYISSSDVDAGGSGRYVIDDRAFYNGAQEARAAWLAAWGTGDGSPPDGAGSPEVVITLTADADGVVSEATAASASLGGTTSYQLVDWSLLPDPIAAPELP